MKERRRMLLTEKIDPLQVFELGNQSLSHGILLSGSFTNIIAYNPDLGKPLYGAYYMVAYGSEAIVIGGIDFTKYRKLCINCTSDVADYWENYYDFYVGYGTNPRANPADYIGYGHPPSSNGTVTIDISNLKGTGYYIMATAWTSGSAHVEVRDIWLE